MINTLVSSTSILNLSTGLPERPDFSQFRFKSIGQAPALFTRLGTPKPGPSYHSPPPEASNTMDTSSDDIFDPSAPAVIPSARRSLFQTLAGEDQNEGVVPSATGVRLPDEIDSLASSGPSRSRTPVPLLADATHANESGVNSLPSRQVSPPAEPSSSTILTTSIREDHDDNPHTIQSSPFSLIAHLSDIVQERAELQKIRDLLRQFMEEREEFGRRSEEAIRSLQRSSQQAQRVMSISEDAFNKTEVFIAKQEMRLEIKKKQAESRILARKDVEKRDTLRRQAQEKRHQEEETRRELDEERRRKEEEDARLLQEAEHRRLKEEEQRKLEEERRKQEEEEAERQKLQAIKERQFEQERLEAEERSKREQLEKEELARKHEEEIRVKLAEKRKKLEEERIQKETAEREAEANRQAEEETRKRLYEERRAAVVAMKYCTPQNLVDNAQEGRDGSAPLLPSPPASSTSSQKHPSPENTISFDNQQLRDAKQAKKSASVANLHSVFVPAVTEAGKLISTDQPLPTMKVEDPPPKPQTRAAKTKAVKAKQALQSSVKKEPISPVVPPPKQLKTDVAAVVPAASLPTKVPPKPNSKPRGPATGPSRKQSTKAAASVRLPTDLPRRPSATEWVPRPARAPSPVRPISPHSPATPPRPFVSRPLTRSPSPNSPFSYTRRSRSPISRARRNDHYSPEGRRSPEPTYRARLDYRREPSPPPYAVPRKRGREHDRWAPSDDPRLDSPPKRRAIYDPKASRVLPRSPPSPRRRQPIQDRFSAPEVPAAYPAITYPVNRQPIQDRFSAPEFQLAYPANRRAIAVVPPTPSSRWAEELASTADTPLIDRMSDQRSPTIPRAPSRKANVPLEQRLTSR